MSLNYDLRNVTLNSHTTGTEDGETVKWGQHTQTLIFATMAVDMGSITKENARTFYTRHKIWQRATGFPMPELTYDVVAAHAGLKTNVTTLSDKDFNKRIMEHLTHEVSWAVHKELDIPKAANVAEAEIAPTTVSPDVDDTISL